MQVQCVHCGKQYSLSDENAGTHFRCRSCRKLSPVAYGESTSVPAVRQRPATARQDGEQLLSAACRACGEEYRLRTSAAGKQFKCRRCGALTAVPPLPVAADPPFAEAVYGEGLPVAEVVSPAHDPFGPLPAAAPDLVQALPATSNYTLTPAPRAAAPPPPKPAKKRKTTWRKKNPRREEAGSDRSDDSSGFGPVVGLIFICGGCGLLFYVYQCFQEGKDPPRKSIGAGLMLIFAGIRMLFS